MHGLEKFNCPHCSAIAQQKWFNGSMAAKIVNSIILHSFLDYRGQIPDYNQEPIKDFLPSLKQQINQNIEDLIPPSFSISTCVACKKIGLWIDHALVYPRKTLVPAPNDDLNEEIKSLYLEAATILHDSPRGATALLRLSLQLLLKQLGKEGKNINSEIKELVSEGLSKKIQQALDILRVVGNHAVHPGQINLDDNKEIAEKLFTIINFIAEELITKPKELDSIYNEIIPQNTQEHIRQRDKKTEQ